MPPKKAPPSSSDDNDEMPVESSSATKKSRGRPRKQQQPPLPPAPTIPTLNQKDKAPATKPAAPARKKAVEQKLEIPETQIVRDHHHHHHPQSQDESDDENTDASHDDELDLRPPQGKSKTSKPAKSAPGKPHPDELADELALLKLKYEKLRRLRTDDAAALHNEQIKALEERDKASQLIIENLKAELKSKSISLQQLQEKDKQLQELERQNSLMEGKIERLLQDHAVLSAKLETARNIGKTPTNSSKAIVTGGATKEFSQHRENLYSDLCGLIVVNVKTDEDGGLEYDCLSTGKNGALHFKLQLDAEDDEDEEDEDGPYFTYNPMLERGRDERLIAVLPPIFRDEMNFKRTRGVDFYLQLMQSLQSS